MPEEQSYLPYVLGGGALLAGGAGIGGGYALGRKITPELVETLKRIRATSDKYSGLAERLGGTIGDVSNAAKGLSSASESITSAGGAIKAFSASGGGLIDQLKAAVPETKSKAEEALQAFREFSNEGSKQLQTVGPKAEGVLDQIQSVGNVGSNIKNRLSGLNPFQKIGNHRKTAGEEFHEYLMSMGSK